MAGEWKTVPFVDVIDIISGGTPRTSEFDYWDGEIPWLSVADFNTGFRWVGTAEKSITEKGLNESATALLGPNDIIISARGTVGAIAQLSRPMAFNQSCYGIKARTDRATSDFIYYALRCRVEEMKRVAHGGVFNTITRDTFKLLQCDLPPLAEQRAIAHILGTLDDMIELNRRMNETLEGIARAVFKSWFVDFDSVRAKAEGRDPGLPKPIADLFPDSFVNSELGEIPRGWGVESFAATIEIIGGGTPKTNVPEYWDGEIPWFSVVDAPKEFDIWVVRTEKKITQKGVENSSTRVLPKGSTIISARGTVGKIALVGIPMAMNQSCYGLRGKHNRDGSFTYFATRDLVSSLKQRAHGSVFDTITRETLAGVKIIVPPASIVEAFEQMVHPKLERMRGNLLECHALATLRDTLLPKLISGGIRVKDAERFGDHRVGESARSQRAGRKRSP